MSLNVDETRLVDATRVAAHTLDGSAGDHDALLDLIGDARFVLPLERAALPQPEPAETFPSGL